MVTIKLAEGPDTFLVGADRAAQLRRELLKPALLAGDEVIIDFADVQGASQSWMNVFLMGALVDCGAERVKQLRFRHCNELTKELVRFAVQKAKVHSKAAIASNSCASMEPVRVL